MFSTRGCHKHLPATGALKRPTNAPADAISSAVSEFAVYYRQRSWHLVVPNPNLIVRRVFREKRKDFVYSSLFHLFNVIFFNGNEVLIFAVVRNDKILCRHLYINKYKIMHHFLFFSNSFILKKCVAYGQFSVSKATWLITAQVLAVRFLTGAPMLGE